MAITAFSGQAVRIAAGRRTDTGVHATGRPATSIWSATGRRER